MLETHRRSLDMNAISQAVSWLSQARQILALGTGGGSTICSQEIQYRLFRLGLPVVSQNDALMMRMMCSAVMPQDVVIVLSLGGYTPEIIESAAIARQYGARVIAITPAQTPLAEQVDLVLPLLVQESDYIFKPTPSRYAMLAMVDVLATELAMANKAQAKDRLRRIKLVLDSHRGGANRQPLGDCRLCFFRFGDHDTLVFTLIGDNSQSFFPADLTCWRYQRHQYASDQAAQH